MAAKNKYYISIDTELYNSLLTIASDNQLAISDLIKLIANINVKTIRVTEFSGKTTRVGYYSNAPLLKINKLNVNYKILKFLELYDSNFG